MDKIKEKEYIYLEQHELRSFLHDVFTFGLIYGGLFANHYLLDKRWYLDLFFIVFALLGVKTLSTLKRFRSKKEIIEYLQKEDTHV